MIIKVLKRLYVKFKKHSSVSNEFIAFYKDLDNEEAHYRATIPTKLFKKYFSSFFD